MTNVYVIWLSMCYKYFKLHLQSLIDTIMSAFPHNGLCSLLNLSLVFLWVVNLNKLYPLVGIYQKLDSNVGIF